MDINKDRMEQQDKLDRRKVLSPAKGASDHKESLYVGLTRDDEVGREPNEPAVALRFNSGKPQLSFILEFPKSITGVANVMEMGAGKYGRDNWKKGGLTHESYMDSCLRHLMKYANGEVIDEESGHNHIEHAIVNLMMAREMMKS